MDPGVSSGKGMESGGRETGKDLNKARLTEFYRIHAPEKVDSVDKVFKLFDGRTDSLNKKLKRKYGKGFLPGEEPKDQSRDVRGGGGTSPGTDGHTIINCDDDTESLSSTYSSISLSRRRSTGSKLLGSKLKNGAIFSKLKYSSSSPDDVKATGDEEASYEQDISNDSEYEYQHFLSLINETTSDTNNKPGDTPKCGREDDKDDNEEESCQGKHQLELIDDEELLPAQQPSLPSDVFPQRIIEELSSSEECTPPTNVGRNDGQDDQQSHIEKLDEDTTDTSNKPEDTPKCGRKDDDDGNEEGSCQGKHQLESLDDEELLLAQQPSLSSDIFPQLLTDKLSSSEECTPPTNVGRNDDQDDQQSQNEQFNEDTTDTSNKLEDTPKYGRDDDTNGDIEGSCQGKHQLESIDDEELLPSQQPSSPLHMLPQPLTDKLSSLKECTPLTFVGKNDGQDDQELRKEPINETTSDTNSNLGDMPKCGRDDDKDGNEEVSCQGKRGRGDDMDGNEEESCQGKHQLESLDDEELQPAQQTSSSSDVFPQPLTAELSTPKECTPPTNVGRNDGQDDQESRKEQIDQAATHTDNEPGDTPKCGRNDDRDGEKKHQLESLDDEELLPAQQLSSSSHMLPQPLTAELSSSGECTPPTNVGRNDGQDDQESRKKQINETTSDTNNNREDTPKCGRGDDMNADEEDSFQVQPQLEILSDELLSSSKQPCTPSHMLPQPFGRKVSSADEYTPPTSISGIELMGRFSSVALGPSPVKLKGDHTFMNIDMSMDELDDDVGNERNDRILSPNTAPISGTHRPHWCSLATIPVVSITGSKYIRVGGGHKQQTFVRSIDSINIENVDRNSSSSPIHPNISAEQFPWPSTSLREAAPPSEPSIECDTSVEISTSPCEAALPLEPSIESNTRQSIVGPAHSETLDAKSSSLHRPSPSSSPDETKPSFTHCISQYSSLKSPSPMKMNHFAFDESMDTTIGMNDSVHDDNVEVNYLGDVDPCDDDTMGNNGHGCAGNSRNNTPTLGDDAGSQGNEPSRARRSPRQSYDDVSAKHMKFKHPSTTKLSRIRSQTSNVTGSTSLLQREYNVDHSCSTPLERLARDVGNTLRQWRVHQGCDWHVSLDWAEKMKDVEKELDEKDSDLDDEVLDGGEGEISCLDITQDLNPPIQCMSMDICERGFANRTKTIHSWMGDENAILSSVDFLLKKPQSQLPSPSKPRPREPIAPPKESRSAQTEKQVRRGSWHRGAQCLRSQKIQFHTTGYSPEQTEDSVNWNRRRYTIPLLLKLWDAPYSPVEARGDIFFAIEIHGCDGTENTVPRSLRSGISSSSFALTGELGVLSPCGTGRVFYNPSSTTPSTSTTDEATVLSSCSSFSELATGLTRDISSLFNIGQHITLCLDLGESTNDTGHGDIESLYNDIRFCIENNINEAIEAQRHALQERRRRRKQRYIRLRKRKHTRLEVTQPRKTQQEQLKKAKNSDVNNYIFNDESFDRDDNSEYDSDESEDSDDEYTLGHDLHLNQQEIHAEVTASLTALLQTALNLAVSENDCSIPVFGIWGDYCGDSRENNKRGRRNHKAAPSWVSSDLERNLLQIRDNFQGNIDEKNAMKLLLSSPALSGMCLSEKFQSTHRLYHIPTQALPLHLSTLNGLAKVLLTQCPSFDGAVVLSAARHRYHWKQRNNNEGYGVPPRSQMNQDWRIFYSASADDDTSPVEMYREQCQQQALRILERASSPLINRPEPMWGPNEGNPLLSLSATVSWGVIPAQDNSSIKPPPLLRLPMKIRSSNFASTPLELLDLEYALQSAALNPIGMGVVENEGGHHEFGPREPVFMACAEFDIDAPCATLSANTRCVLAALLRCGSLGLDTLPGHLTKRNIIANFSQHATSHVAGESSSGEDLTNTENVLRKSLGLAKVGPVTKRLLDALEWGDIEMDLSAADFDRATNEALQRIQTTTYPAPPAEVFSIGVGNGKLPSTNHKPSHSKGSPPGRLLSILFAHMARLRTPPSMMRLWLSFVEELRTHWDNNESLPNLGFVPGLDSNGDAGKPHWGLQKVNTLGHKADHAAFVNSSEPDPDRDHCIINQNLQVYNICIECKMSVEALRDKRSNTHDDETNESIESVGDESDNHASSEDDDEFFDPEPAETDTFETDTAFDGSPDAKQKNRDIARMLMLQAAVMTPSHNRIGARCPVPDALPLKKSGDQLYAPYLQRTMPMTDEEEQKQKKFMGFGENTERRPSIKSRIAIAQRLQRPKLLSDMSSFKAANHGAVFEDFVRWYGNPENPLNEEVNGETARLAIERRSRLPPEEAKTLALEEASEAIAILMSLRAFWEDVWDEAEPCPAFDQEPLFDPNSTVEMVLHSFETMHPALLLNQVLSVTLTNVKFVLLERAAGPARNVRSVALGLANLRAAIDDALEMLTKDAADGFLHLSPEKLTDDSGPLAYVSTLTITKCEDACNLIGDLEMLLSRALPLLRVLPGEYDLVDSLLQCKDGEFRFLKDPSQRSALLQAIKHRQTCTSDSTPEAIPVMREYVLRNLDPTNPCQLGARLVSNLKEAQSASLFHGSLLMALTKSSNRA